MAGGRQPLTLELTEDLIEIQAIAQEWMVGDDWENARHSAEMTEWDHTERQMVNQIAKIAQKWATRIDIERERPLQINA